MGVGRAGESWGIRSFFLYPASDLPRPAKPCLRRFTTPRDIPTGLRCDLRGPFFSKMTRVFSGFSYVFRYLRVVFRQCSRGGIERCGVLLGCEGRQVDGGRVGWEQKTAENVQRTTVKRRTSREKRLAKPENDRQRATEDESRQQGRDEQRKTTDTRRKRRKTDEKRRTHDEKLTKND